MLMRTPAHARSWMMLACFLSLALILISAAANGAQSDVAIIVNPVNSVSNLTLAELRKIYMGERQDWMASLPVYLLMRFLVALVTAAILMDRVHMCEQILS